MTPVITDPERFDVVLPDSAPDLDNAGHRFRLYTYRGTIWLDDVLGRSPSALALPELRWLRDRFNEILGEVPK